VCPRGASPERRASLDRGGRGAGDGDRPPLYPAERAASVTSLGSGYNVGGGADGGGGQ